MFKNIVTILMEYVIFLKINKLLFLLVSIHMYTIRNNCSKKLFNKWI